MKPNSDISTILFDLDGTLVDHFNVLYRCYAHTLESIGKPVPTFDAVKRAVGGSMEQTMRSFVNEDELEQASRVFWEVFRRTFLDEVTVLPHGRELLEALKKNQKTLAVYTNKQGEASRAICEHVGLTPYLDAVFGANDTAWRKPQAEFTAHVLQELGVSAATSCMVGDSPYDIQTAHNGRIPCYCVTTGTHSAAELKEAGADGVFESLEELGKSVFGVTLGKEAV